MKLITRDTDYAIRALRFILANKDKTVTSSDIVRELAIPGPFLRKILQRLNKKGILKSQKGKSGGFLAAKKADRIFLTDLIEIFQGPLRLNECFFKKLICPDLKKCALRKKIKKVESYVTKELKTITLASLLQ